MWRRASALGVASALGSLGTAARAHAQSLTPGGGTPTVHITTAVAGSAPTAVQVATTTLAYTTANGSTGQTLQAKLSAALPAGVTMQISVNAPAGSTTLGLVTMTTSYANLTGVIPKNQSGTLTITHRLTATSAAGVQALTSRTITFQLF